MNLDNITLAAKHVPSENGGPFSTIQEAIAAGYDTVNPITGSVQIGFTIDGAFVPFYSEKASLVAARIEQAKANAAQAGQDAPAGQGGAAGSGQPSGEPQPGQPEQPHDGTPGSGQESTLGAPAQPPAPQPGEPQG